MHTLNTAHHLAAENRTTAHVLLAVSGYTYTSASIQLKKCISNKLKREKRKVSCYLRGVFDVESLMSQTEPELLKKYYAKSSACPEVLSVALIGREGGEKDVKR